MLHQIAALILVAGCTALGGCADSEIAPPENPPKLAVDDFPACVVTINGETLSDDTFSFQSGDSLKFEVALTYREGVDPDLVQPCIIHIIKGKNDSWENVAYWGTNLVDDPMDVKENTLYYHTEWTPELEPGTYGLYVCTAIAKDFFSSAGIPMEAVTYHVVEVQPK